MNQHPRVRALPVCIECGGLKDAGLLLCWPCHREQKRANAGSYDNKLETNFELIETGLVYVDQHGRLHPAVRA